MLSTVTHFAMTICPGVRASDTKTLTFPRRSRCSRAAVTRWDSLALQMTTCPVGVFLSNWTRDMSPRKLPSIAFLRSDLDEHVTLAVCTGCRLLDDVVRPVGADEADFTLLCTLPAELDKRERSAVSM